MDLVKHRFAKPGIVLARLNPRANLGEPRLAEDRIVDEAVFFDGGGDALFEVIAADEILIVDKWNAESRRHSDPGTRVDQFAQVRRLGAKANGVDGALVLQVG